MPRKLARSMLFRDLVTRLDTSDVIVYIEPDCRMPSSLDGRLTFMSSTGGRRYVMVRIACLLELRRTIATIGHELRHAVEIAEADSVVDDSTLARLYEKTGFASRVLRPSAGYDTHMAIEAGRQVWDELVQAAE